MAGFMDTLRGIANRTDELIGDPIERGVNSVAGSIGDALRSTPSDVVDFPYNTVKNATRDVVGGIKKAAPVAQKLYTGKTPVKTPKMPSAVRTRESVGTELADTAAGDATVLDPFASLNSLIPDPLTMQLFYNQTVAPLIQQQVKQMTDYGELLKSQPGGGGLGQINQQLGNQYGALAAALGAQATQQPSFDALLKQMTDAKQQQTDIYSLIRSLISAQQQPVGDLAALLAQVGLGQG